MANSTLDAIRTKIRRLTRAPSEAQLTTTQLDEYVNTFVLYDFPEHLRLFALHTDASFYTTPNVDEYSSDGVVSPHPLANIENEYITFNPPVYIAGIPGTWTQSRDQFYGWYPKVASIRSIGVTGDGATTAYAGTIASAPFLRGEVLIEAEDANGNGMPLIDEPVVGSSTGNMIYANNGVNVGTINYVTGAFSVTFPNAPALGVTINSQVVPFQAAQPRVVLYYDNKFFVRPVPDQVYKIQMEAYIRPTELLASNQSPDLEQWWQYIAYGAAKKIFEDRMDLESVALILPEFTKQERLVLRRTIVQQTNVRTPTIYTEQAGLGTSWGWGSNFNN